MAWRDNPLGIVLNGTKSADLKRLKAEGLSFVVVEGAVGPEKRNPQLSKVIQDAYDNDLPVLIMFTPYPDQEQVTVKGNIEAHMPVAQAITRNFLFHGFIVNADRNWTGTDYEEYLAGKRAYSAIRWSTDANISDVNKAIVEGMEKFFGAQGKSIPVFTRTSDGFVQNYSSGMANWVGLHPFFLADWRYRIPNPDDNGLYNKYVIYGTTPTPVETLAVLREQLPPTNAKNPLVPGAATPLKFWEFSGQRFVHPAVLDLNGKLTTANFVLFNGTVEVMHAFLNYTPKPAPDTTPPGVPAGLTVVAQGNGVMVSWVPPKYSGDDIVGYTVYRNDAPIFTQNDLTKLFYEDKPLPMGVYAYTVDAFDAAGNRSNKAPVQIVSIDPQDPGGDPGGDPGDSPVSGKFFQRLEAALTAAARAWLEFK